MNNTNKLDLTVLLFPRLLLPLTKYQSSATFLHENLKEELNKREEIPPPKV